MAQEAGTQSSIVMIRGGALGDHVVTLPAVHALRQQFPDACLGWIGHPTRGQLARPRYLIDADGPIGTTLYGGTSTGLPDWLLGAHRVMVYSSDAAGLVAHLQSVCEGQVTGWDPRPPAESQLHQTTYLATAVRPSPDAGAALAPSFVPSDLELAQADRRWSDLGLTAERVVLLHAGSGGAAKCWRPEGFLSVGDALERQGWSITMLDGPAEDEHPDAYRQLTRRWPVLRAGHPVQLAALLSRIRCLIGNDSGPGHLAAAVGTPTLSIFGPTDPAQWRPVGPHSHVIEAPAGNLQDLDDVVVLQRALELLGS